MFQKPRREGFRTSGMFYSADPRHSETLASRLDKIDLVTQFGLNEDDQPS